MKRVLATLLLVAGCAGTGSSTYPARALKAAAIPPVVASADPGLYGYLRLKDAPTLIDKLGMIELYQKMRAKVPLEDVVGNRLGGIFAWDAGPASMGVPLVAMALGLPTSSATSIGIASQLNKPAKENGPGTLFEVSPGGADKAAANGDVWKLLSAPLDGQLDLVIKIQPLRKRYGAFIDMALAQTSAKSDAQSRLGQKGVEMIRDWMQTADEVRLILRAEGDHLDLDVITHDTAAPTEVDAPYGPAVDLVSFLAPAAIRGELDGARSHKLQSQFMLMFTSMLDSSSTAFRDRFKVISDKMKVASTQLRFAFASDLASGKSVSTTIAYGKGAAAYRSLFVDSNQLLNDPAVVAELKAIGITVKSELRPNVRQLHGAPVDQLIVDIDLPESMQKKKTPFSERHHVTEVVQVGDVMVTTNNAPPELLGKVLGDVLGKKRVGPPLRAAADFAQLGTAHFDVDIGQFYDAIRKDSTELGKLRPLPGGPFIATFYGARDGNAGYYRMRIPQSLVTAIKDAAR